MKKDEENSKETLDRIIKEIESMWYDRKPVSERKIIMGVYCKTHGFATVESGPYNPILCYDSKCEYCRMMEGLIDDEIKKLS